MKKLIFSFVLLTACSDSNKTTNSFSQISTTAQEQLDCHDPALDICAEHDYSKDICEVTFVEVYVSENQCNDTAENVCR